VDNANSLMFYLYLLKVFDFFVSLYTLSGRLKETKYPNGTLTCRCQTVRYKFVLKDTQQQRTIRTSDRAIPFSIFIFISIRLLLYFHVGFTRGRRVKSFSISIWSDQRQTRKQTNCNICIQPNVLGVMEDWEWEWAGNGSGWWCWSERR